MFFCQSIHLCTLCIASQVKSKTMGAFLLAAKEVLRREIRTTKSYGRACCASTALRAGSAHAPRSACRSAAAGLRATMARQTLTALRPSYHGGSGPAVVTGEDVG